MMKSTYPTKKLKTHDHVSVPRFSALLISVFSDATPQQILGLGCVPWQLDNTGHSLRQSQIIIIIIIIIIIKKLNCTIRKELVIKSDSEHWYEHVPKSVETGQVGKVTVLWNEQVQTDRTIPNNKPDIITRGSEKGTCMLIDVAIPGDRNVIKKEAEKILKYKDLTTEIQRMWHVETQVTPVTIGATGTISKSFRKYLSSVPGQHDIKELQKTSVLGTAHTLREVLM
jgi:hypothetical protein